MDNGGNVIRIIHATFFINFTPIQVIWNSYECDVLGQLSEWNFALSYIEGNPMKESMFSISRHKSLVSW